MALAIIYLALIPIFIRSYFVADANLIMSLVLIPYILRTDKGSFNRFRFVWFVAPLIILSLTTGVATFYFLSVGFTLLLLLDSFVGKVNWLPVFLLGVICPAFKYFNNIFGFEVRLRLSDMAGGILSIIGYKVEVSGNIMLLNNCEFSVDAACVGLKMMVLSVLAGLLIMAYFERKTLRSFRFATVSLMLAGIIILNILTNLLRIIILVVFHILPENPSHDLIGILCLLLYTIVPAYFMVQAFSRKAIQPEKSEISIQTDYKVYLAHGILIAFLVTTGLIISKEQPLITEKFPELNMAGYSKTVISKEVAKYERAGVLVYVKPIGHFYGTEHNPMICWIGSGFEFRKITTTHIGGKEVYTGELIKGKEKLYSAWWFDSGGFQTISQMGWRWKAFRGEKFYLVNVSCETKPELEREVKTILATDHFR